MGANISGSLDSNQHVKADRRRLQQVLLNLLSNAIKYNRPGGKVEISCESAAPDRVRIKVCDTGTGMPPEYQSRVFAPFDRLHADQSDVQGTGLGLTLSKRLIELMAGRIGLESEPGSGTTFWIDLPGTEDPSTRIDSKRLLPKAIPQSGSVTTILCVDDNTANQQLIEYLFEQIPQTRLLCAIGDQPDRLLRSPAGQRVCSSRLLPLRMSEATCSPVICVSTPRIS
jgi:anti-sigma regulatory factor (Ser/Thr protein kinase)